MQNAAVFDCIDDSDEQKDYSDLQRRI